MHAEERLMQSARRLRSATIIWQLPPRTQLQIVRFVAKLSRGSFSPICRYSAQNALIKTAGERAAQRARGADTAPDASECCAILQFKMLAPLIATVIWFETKSNWGKSALNWIDLPRVPHATDT